MRDLIDQILPLVKDAGERAARMQPDAAVRRKADGSVVTRADELVQEFLREELRRIAPDVGFLGEESGELVGPRGAYWALDPIDGTESYIVGLPVWGVSLGYVEDSRPLLGFLFFPRLGEWYHTGGDGVVYRNGEAVPGAAQRAHTRTWLVPSNAHRRYRVRFGGKTRSLGSTAYHLAALACGAVEGVLLGRPHMWDMAAGLALALSRGARLEDLEGREESFLGWERYRPPAHLVCALPDALNAVRGRIEVVRRKG